MIKFDNVKTSRVRPQEITTEVELDNRLRPSSFTDYIGQDNFKRQLEIFIKAAKKRSDALDHTLLYGPPGLGKTTLAKIIANELTSNLRECSASTITRTGDLAAILTSLQRYDVLFIDEIHRLPASIEELLYSCMEDFRLDILVGEGASAKTLNLSLEPFTLVGATTRIGMISKPLRDRFGIMGALEFYNDAQLVKILHRTAKLFNLGIKDDVATEIASRSRGTPRIANRLLRRIRDFANVAEKSDLDMALVKNALLELNIDNNGLDNADRSYLQILIEKFAGGPVGIDNLATAMNEDKSTLEDAVEPFLIQKGYIKRTPRGRMIQKEVYTLDLGV